MEYLNSIFDELKTINEKNIKYYDIFNTDEITVYGCPFYSFNKTFKKFSVEVDCECANDSLEGARRDYSNLSVNTSGACIKLKTNSDKIIVKAQLKRKWDYVKLNRWNSHGFDVYEEIDNVYYHRTVFGPKTGENIFAECIGNNSKANILIYLPTYTEIEKLYIGVNSEMQKCSRLESPPIVFFGNSITQGASASRSGNTFVNIVSRLLNNEVYNLSCSSNCKGQLSIAKEIGGFNAKAIVIDYTRNAYNSKEFRRNYRTFYDALRTYHKNTLIILMTVSNFNNQIEYQKYNTVVYETYQYAKNSGHNTCLLNQQMLFEKFEYDLVSLDGSHYTDMGMYRVAEALVNIIREKNI